MSRETFPRIRPPEQNIPLKQENSIRALIIFLIVFSVFWDGVVAIILYQEGFQGGIQWLFLLIFGGIGIVLPLVAVFLVVRAILLRRFFGTPRVMVDHHPVCLGDTIRVATGQAVKRDVLIPRARLQLVAEEEATWRRGTNTYTEERVVFKREQVYEAPMDSNRLIQLLGEFEVPANAMHTLSGKNNKLTWKVIYEVEAVGCPDVKSFFELAVMPLRARPVEQEHVPPLQPRVIRPCDGAELTFDVAVPERGCFLLGETMEGALVIEAHDRVNCRGVNAELVWCTSGKGDPEEHTIWSSRVHEGPLEPGSHRYEFRIALPDGPACYDGELINLVWELRAWVDLAFRRDPGIAHPIWVIPPLAEARLGMSPGGRHA